MPPSTRPTSPVLAAMLGAMPVGRLLAVLQDLDLPPPRGRPPTRAALVERLAGDERATVAAVARAMRLAELRRACGACGLDPKANRAEVLERHLIAADAGRDAGASPASVV